MNNRSSSMSQYGTSYKRGTLFFPKALRKKVYIVYAFVRAADQLVDTPGVSTASAARDLDKMEQKTALAWEGKEIDDELIQAFVAVGKEHDFAWEWIEAFFRAMRMDTEISVYTTYEQLHSYMHGSAEVIGLMMTQLIGFDGKREHVFHAAKKLGEAMQYTNFLRDVAEDRRDHSRVYMPLERLAEHGLTAEEVKNFVEAGKGDDRWKVFCQTEALFAQDLYMEAIEGIASLHRQGRFAVRVAMMLYAGILWKIERVGYDQIAQDAHTTKREKFRLFLGARKTYKY